MAEQAERGFEFNDQHFYELKELIYQEAGIALSEAKRQMMYSRLARRLRALKMQTFDEYCRLLKAEPEKEMTEFVNAITTNLTYFYRENHHFEFLENKLIPFWKKQRSQSKKIRIWSAGCSSGEEPYSLAIVLKEQFTDSSGWDIKILATDLDTAILDRAKKGVYLEDALEKVPQNRQKKWFKRGSGANQGKVMVSSKLKDMIAFKQLNLFGSWPMKGKFDLIICRNVLIYFDKESQGQIIRNFNQLLPNDGWLFVGHSENITNLCDDLQLQNKSMYKKV